MPKIDVTKYIEQSGIRKARFGGFEQEDVRQAMMSLCSEYEQRLTRAETSLRKVESDSAALEQHCRTLAAQNQKLSTQNATLAGSSEKYSRRMSDLDTQLSSATEKLRSLGDQIAVIRLKNSDLVKENESLKDRAEQAEAALRIKGRALDTAKAELEEKCAQKLTEADEEAEKIIAEANEKAEKIEADATLHAEAVDRTAREQAQKQAQDIVDAATAEANEVQNAHQLRLNNLHAEVRNLERQRDAALMDLNELGTRLIKLRENTENDIEIAAAKPQEKAPEDVIELEAIPATQAKLDFSEEKLADAMQAVQAEDSTSEPQEANQQPEEPQSPEKQSVLAKKVPVKPVAIHVEPVPVARPEPPTLKPASDFFEDEPSSMDSPNQQTGPALTEIPGAIFSAPLVRTEEPAPDDVPPTAAPRKPLMPSLQEDDEEDEEKAADDKQSLARRKALSVVRAINRKLNELQRGQSR